VMTGYNKVNGEYAGGNAHLLQDVLKGTWGYRGWVMSDWGATPTWEFALKGLDQECGAQIDVLLWKAEAFTEALETAYAHGELPPERLSDMVRRILRSMYAVGVDAWADAEAPEVDMEAHEDVALESARQGIVLLRNEDMLPLRVDTTARIAVVGGWAQLGVPIGIGSSAVTPPGGYAAEIPIGGPGVMGGMRNLLLLPSSPLAELRRLLPHAEIEFDPGMSPAEAAHLARRSDVAIVFAIRVEGEGYDAADLSLPWGQDAVIEAVAAANPRTIVVLETGNPVAMPWRDDVEAILEAWYPGQAGGRAIAEILTGHVNPSGRLPVTFPAGLDQTPRPELDALAAPWGTPVTIDYHEGAEVGYRWFAHQGETPLYAFGHGLSYTTFEYDDLLVEAGETVVARFTVTNTGSLEGADVPQVYLTHAAGEPRTRLLGFERVELRPGESRSVTVTADPRLLARYDGDAGAWHVEGGNYRVAVGASADDLVLAAEVQLLERRFGR
jgi:beta-glucosidase